MSRHYRFLFASLAVLTIGLFAASFASAADEPANPPARQRGQGRGAGGQNIFAIEVVAKDLELTDDQKASIKKIADKASEDRQALSADDRATKGPEIRKDMDEKIAAVLNDKQKARVKEIRLQMRGTAALADKEVAESLKLTDDQVAKIKDAMDARRKAMADARPTGGNQGGDRDAAREKFTKMRKEADEKVLAVLTTEQKEQFDKMQGTKLELPAAGFGGGQGRRNRGNPDSTTPKPDASKPDTTKPADSKPTDPKPDSK
jgi:Spy/CpxP family protein refolding chaperone